MSGSSKTLVKAVLILLYVAAVWSRAPRGEGPEYPYFTGASATYYRYAQRVAAEGSLPDVDLKTAWPDGYRPLQAGPTGAEYATGLLFRVVSAFSDVPPKRFATIFVELIASLSIFTVYLLAMRWWQCLPAALLAAVLAGFSTPVIGATNGVEFTHGAWAFVLVTFHLALVLGYRDAPSTKRAVPGALALAALLAVWEGAGLYLAFFALVVLCTPGTVRRDKVRLLLIHAGAIAVAIFVLPHLRAQRFLVSWPVALTAVVIAEVILEPRLPRRIPRLAYVAIGFALLALLLRPLQSGGVQTVSEAAYWWSRIRFAFGKPEDPALLSSAARYLWVQERTFPSGYTLVQFWLPLLFLLPSVSWAVRRLERGKIVLPVLLAVTGTLCFLLDRSAVLFAAAGLFPLVGAAAVGLGRRSLARGALVLVGIALLVVQVVRPTGRFNEAYQIGLRMGLFERSDGFLWVSLGNAERELLGHVVTRTSTRDVILAPPETSSFLTTFTGRTTIPTPGIFTRASAQRARDVTSAYFVPEPQFYALCKQLGAGYVLYRIDYLLDGSKNGPAYQAGLRRVDEGSVAARMHFAPQSLDHFALVYENDHYRLFRVTDEPQPVFLTDHPLVYQRSILERHKDTLSSFYDRIVDLLVTYTTALEAQVAGDEDGAIRRFRYCLEQAPYFSPAWLGVGDSLLRKGDHETAYAAYKNVLVYAPDNPHALYYGAVALVRAGRREEALGLIDVLLSSTGDREYLSLGRELKASLDRQTPERVTDG